MVRNVKLNKNKIFEIPDNFTERKNKETTHQTFLGVARNFVFLRSEWMKNFWKHLERKIFVEIFNNNWTTPDTKRKRTLKKWRKIFQFSFHLAYSKLAEAFWFMMIYEEAIKSWFLAPMFWGQFRCCREKYQRKSCALLLHFFCCSFSFATGEMDFFFQVVVEADGVWLIFSVARVDKVDFGGSSPHTFTLRGLTFDSWSEYH